MTVTVQQRNHMWIGSLLSSGEKAPGLLDEKGEVILNQTIVSDVARLHLDFILCDDSLHIPLLLGDVPDGTSAGTGTRGRENRPAQDTNIISITD